MIGHNDHIAWGFTTTTADVEDLFVEKVDPADPGHYLTPDGSAPVRHAAGKDPGARCRAGRFSPCARPGTARSCRMYCRRARPTPATCWRCRRPFSMPHDRSAEALWNVDHATDWPSFRAAWRDFVGPMQNTVYADDSGTIGFIAPGLVPIREKGDGWMPAPGWTGEYDWKGFIPFDALPQATNPRLGPFRQRQQQDRARQLSLFPQPRLGFAEPRRTDRGVARRRTPVQTPASSAAIEADTFSLMAKRAGAADDRASPPPTRPRARPSSRCGIGIFTWTATRWRRCCSPPGCAQFSHAVLFGRFGDAVAGYWDLKPQVIEAVLTRRPDWCADPKRPGSRDLRHPARAIAARGARRAAPRLWRRYERMAVGPGACRGLRQPGASAASRCCATGSTRRFRPPAPATRSTTRRA